MDHNAATDDLPMSVMERTAPSNARRTIRHHFTVFNLRASSDELSNTVSDAVNETPVEQSASKTFASFLCAPTGHFLRDRLARLPFVDLPLCQMQTLSLSLLPLNDAVSDVCQFGDSPLARLFEL